jgi:pyruvate dehydrogenase E2 component (dihydrolipoamide acetyltransferase)
MTPPTTIPMPQLTEQMEEATIAKWLIEPGQAVAIGDELVEIETDKATMAYASELAGYLEQLVEEGESVTVGSPIARLHSIPVSAHDAPAPAPASPESHAPIPAGPSKAPGVHPPSGQGSDDDALATPLARRAAADLGVTLSEVEGTGPRGRILQNDIRRAAGQTPAEPSRPLSAPRTPAAAPPVRAAETLTDSGERRELSTIQRTIARRMAEAKATIPHFQVSCDVTVDAALRTRAELQEQLGDGVRGPSLNDFIVRACALALRSHELVNASFAGDHFRLHQNIHVGVAVASDAGLLVATLANADRRSILAIAEETRRLASSVRAGTAAPAELTGATFTVSNLGMFGMTSIVPVINPPQAAILGVGAARDELYLHEGQATSRQVATLTLSGDHRILNGADAARFLSDVKDLIQTPLRLLAT